MALSNITHVVQKLQLSITNLSNNFGSYLQTAAWKAERTDISNTYGILLFVYKERRIDTIRN
jgi:hypothetical protein